MQIFDLINILLTYTELIYQSHIYAKWKVMGLQVFSLFTFPLIYQGILLSVKSKLVYFDVLKLHISRFLSA